jgi:hypothetical protein
MTRDMIDDARAVPIGESLSRRGSWAATGGHELAELCPVCGVKADFWSTPARAAGIAAVATPAGMSSLPEMEKPGGGGHVADVHCERIGSSDLMAQVAPSGPEFDDNAPSCLTTG